MYINGDYTVQRTSMVIILCSIHHWWLYCAAYINGDYTVQRTSMVIILCSIHHWWLYCAVYTIGDYTVQCSSLVIILCSVHHWWLYGAVFIIGDFPDLKREFTCIICAVVKSIQSISVCRFWKLNEWELDRESTYKCHAFFKSNLTTSKWPFWEAKWKGNIPPTPLFLTYISTE